MRSHKRAFTVAITFISRVIALRDRLTGWKESDWQPAASDDSIARHVIVSGSNCLDAVFARPAQGFARASVLICHGIGETVEYWLSVQRLLAENGVASLVFDYSGYGKSTGTIDWRQCEEDAVAAFRFLQQQTPEMPVSLLGFSMGSGIAAAITPRVEAHRLVLCAAFTSFRDAAHALGVPRAVSRGVPPIWRAEESLRDCSLPVLVVHGDRDRLFPVQMASKLASCCGKDTELIIVPNLGHNQPYSRPEVSYWGPIVAWLISKDDAVQ